MLYLGVTMGEIHFETIFPGLGNINALEVSSTDSQVIWIVTNNGVYKVPDIFTANPHLKA